jgi:hypothetical protein
MPALEGREGAPGGMGLWPKVAGPGPADGVGGSSSMGACAVVDGTSGPAKEAPKLGPAMGAPRLGPSTDAVGAWAIGGAPMASPPPIGKGCPLMGMDAGLPIAGPEPSSAGGTTPVASVGSAVGPASISPVNCPACCVGARETSLTPGRCSAAGVMPGALAAWGGAPLSGAEATPAASVPVVSVSPSGTSRPCVSSGVAAGRIVSPADARGGIRSSGDAT